MGSKKTASLRQTPKATLDGRNFWSTDQNLTENQNDLHWLNDVFADNSSLATNRLIRLVQREKLSAVGSLATKVLESVIAIINEDLREQVLTSINCCRWSRGKHKIEKSIVGKSQHLFHFLLKTKILKNYHLAPLESKPTLE